MNRRTICGGEMCAAAEQQFAGDVDFRRAVENRECTKAHWWDREIIIATTDFDAAGVQTAAVNRVIIVRTDDLYSLFYVDIATGLMESGRRITEAAVEINAVGD